MSTRLVSSLTTAYKNEDTSIKPAEDRVQLNKVQEYFHNQLAECIFITSLQQVQYETLLDKRNQKIKEFEHQILLLKRELESKEQELLAANKKIKQFENP